MGIVDPATAVVGAIIELTKAVINFGKESIQAFSDVEMIKTNLEIVMGSAEQAAASFDEIRAMAGKTPFNVDQLADAAVQLKQTGTAAGELIPVLTMLGNTAGGSSDKFNRIVANFAQIQSVGKTTAMDLKQFAMMGIPIYAMFEEMGVKGNATGEQVSEAFRRMTDKGGVFYNAMEKGSVTLQGKVANLEGTWKSLQATIVDKTGLDNAIKYIADAFQFYLAYLDDFINKESELAEAEKAFERGIFTEAQALLVLNDRIKSVTNEYERLYDIVFSEYGASSWRSSYNADFMEVSETLGALRKQYDLYADIIDREKARTAELEKQRKLVEDTQKEYENAKSFLQTLYADTPEGKLQELINRRDMAKTDYQKLLQGKTEIVPGYTTPYGVQTQDRIKNIPTDPKELEEARIGIAGLQKQIDDMIASMNKAETPEWIKILQSNTGFSLKQMERLWNGLSEGRSLPVIEQFEKVMELRNEAGKTFAGLTGGENISVYQAEYDTWTKMVQDMMTVQEETLKDGSKVWKRAWEDNEQAFQEAVDNMNKAQNNLDLKNFEKYLADLERNNELLSMSPNERVWVQAGEKLKAAGVSTPMMNQIQQVIDSQGAGYLAQIEQEYRQILMDTEESAIHRLAIEKNISEEAARQAITKQQHNNAVSYGKEIQTELDLVLKNTHDEAVARLMIEKDITQVDAERLLKEQKHLDYIKEGNDYLAQFQEQMQDALESIRAGNGGYGEYAKAKAREGGMDLIQGSDVGAFVEGTAKGGPIVGLINMFMNALANVIGGIEGVSTILSPITSLLEGLTPLIKVLLIPLALLSAGLRAAANVLSGFLDWFLGDMDELYDSLVQTNDEREREAELLRKLNEQYGKLRDSIAEQEAYYLKKRRELNADWSIEGLGVQSVNDMILTPRAIFRQTPTTTS
jgi:hypothetical protein